VVLGNRRNRAPWQLYCYRLWILKEHEMFLFGFKVMNKDFHRVKLPDFERRGFYAEFKL